jgi:hypothetical protein
VRSARGAKVFEAEAVNQSDPVWRFRPAIIEQPGTLSGQTGMAGRGWEQTDADAHLYFFDRYCRLATYHRSHGRARKAARFQAKADAHYRAGRDDGPPYAAAMAMPRPASWVRTDLVSHQAFHDPEDAA